jgi:hypothetical protein
LYFRIPAAAGFISLANCFCFRVDRVIVNTLLVCRYTHKVRERVLVSCAVWYSPINADARIGETGRIAGVYPSILAANQRTVC